MISVSKGCAPSIPSRDPVITTTIRPNSTTTTTTSPAPNITTTTTTTTIAPPTNTTTTILTTTTTVTTTTTSPPLIPDGCCGYPIPDVGVNSARPVRSDWNGCNQTISIQCQASADGTYREVRVVGNYSSGGATLASGLPITGAVIMCNPDLKAWYGQNPALAWTIFNCVYVFRNGSTLVGG
ncbi:C6 domain-containing protein [Caenorhabditis elegans]|uniref:C6 domain-containing protein n=1 Tax=Caenorhabditis elegans TaxID=6239 RepID=Q7YTN5_CAEEL|nr:C6 domain-containing protein [Caenorhabditis elegans]CAE17808.1 C6 domain-containing protein [Caenorhabditis elegans]|eukprot:NP_001024621.1 Uncharacterized protein CELE_F31B9.4 [Caenorhabditis elegans]